MRILLYIVVLVSLLFVPLEKVDVAKLLPIEAVAVYTDGGNVVLETSTKEKGIGADVHQALANLIETTPAVVYLDTARYLFVSKEAMGEVEALKAYLKPTVRVAVCDAAGKVEYAMDYLQVHGRFTPLGEWEATD